MYDMQRSIISREITRSHPTTKLKTIHLLGRVTNFTEKIDNTSTGSASYVHTWATCHARYTIAMAIYGTDSLLSGDYPGIIGNRDREFYLCQ